MSDNEKTDSGNTTMGMDAHSAARLHLHEGEHRLTKDEYREFRNRLDVLEQNRDIPNSSATISVPSMWPIAPDIKAQVKQALDEWDEERADVGQSGPRRWFHDQIPKCRDAVAKHGLDWKTGFNVMDVILAGLDQAKFNLAERDKHDGEYEETTKATIADQEATIAALAEQVAQFETTLGGKTCKRLLKACEELDVEPGKDVTQAVIDRIKASINGCTSWALEVERLKAENRSLLTQLASPHGSDCDECSLKAEKVKAEKLFQETDTERCDLIEERNDLDRRLDSAKAELLDNVHQLASLGANNANLRSLREKEGEDADKLLAEIKRLKTDNAAYEKAYHDIVSLVRDELTPEQAREVEKKHDLKATVVPE